MPEELKVPEAGESIREVVVGTWMKNDGDYVKRDEAVVEVETDKVNQELNAPAAGILRIKAEEGETVDVGGLLATIEEGEPPADEGKEEEQKEEKEPEGEPEKAEEEEGGEEQEKEQVEEDRAEGEPVDIKVPEAGESIREVVLGTWMKNDGDYVERDEPVVEMETDKVNQELNAPASGILETLVDEGETVDIGAVIGRIAPGKKPSKKKKAEEEKRGKEKEREQEKEIEGKKEKAKKEEPEVEMFRDQRISSVARKLAAERDVDLKKVKGTGPHGRITKEDVMEYVESGDRTEAGKEEEAPRPSEMKPKAEEKAAEEREKKPERKPREEGEPGRKVTRERMSSLRKKIAVHLVRAQQNAAMLTTFNEADMSAVIALRKKYAEDFEEKNGVRLGFMSFFIKASIEALREFPKVNASIEDDDIVYHHYHDIGIAVGTERGLVVPVIRNAGRMSFAELEKAIREYAGKARDGKLTMEDLSGGTFTITNGGVYGSLMSTPILNPPQSGILGMHKIMERPVVEDGEMKVKPMMYLALSYDHRVIDGSESVRFLVRLKECIESPEMLLLEV